MKKLLLILLCVPMIGFGQCVGNCENGQGRETYDDGRTYTGAFKNNTWHGQGTATFPNGEIYLGGWKENKRKFSVSRPLVPYPSSARPLSVCPSSPLRLSPALPPSVPIFPSST